MDIIQMTILAVGLSMDSLAIALTSGAVIRNYNTVKVLKIAGMLAFIQMMLIAIGWYMGSYFTDYLGKYDHWLAFLILTLLGGKVIYENVRGDDETKSFNPLNFIIMLTLAIAASIDAAAVGLSLSFLDESIVLAALVVGLVTLLLSCFGVICGCKVGCRCTKRVNLAGGIILVIIGCTILFEHTIAFSGLFSSF